MRGLRTSAVLVMAALVSGCLHNAIREIDPARFSGDDMAYVLVGFRVNGIEPPAWGDPYGRQFLRYDDATGRMIGNCRQWDRINVVSDGRDRRYYLFRVPAGYYYEGRAQNRLVNIPRAPELTPASETAWPGAGGPAAQRTASGEYLGMTLFHAPAGQITYFGDWEYRMENGAAQVSWTMSADDARAFAETAGLPEPVPAERQVVADIHSRNGLICTP